MRLLRKKTEVEIIELLKLAVDNTQRATDTLSEVTANYRDAMKLVEQKDGQIERLSRELQSLQVLRDWPSLSSLVH